MKLYLLKIEENDIITEHSVHYSDLLETGLCTVISDVSSGKDGIIFRPIYLLSEETSLLFKNKHYTYQFLQSIVSYNSELSLFNNSYVILEYNQIKDIILPMDLFIKPNNKIKTFQPVILKRGEKFSNLGLTSEESDGLQIITAPVKDISNTTEYRCVVFNSTLISIYNQTENPVKCYAYSVYNYALNCIRTIQQTDKDLIGYVLDLIVNENGICSIMELNPLETSGFFSTDYTQILKLLEKAEIKNEI